MLGADGHIQTPKWTPTDWNDGKMGEYQHFAAYGGYSGTIGSAFTNGFVGMPTNSIDSDNHIGAMAAWVASLNYIGAILKPSSLPANADLTDSRPGSATVTITTYGSGGDSLFNWPNANQGQASSWLPDAVGIGFSFKNAPSLSFQIALTRNGTVFFNQGYGAGASLTGFNIALSASYLQSPGNIDSVMSGPSMTGMSAVGPGAGITNGFSGNGTNDYYFGTPQVSAGVSLGTPILHTGAHW
jgi:hypothetical protein